MRKINSEEVRRLYESGWTVRQISRHLGFTYAGIRRRLVRDGVKIRERRSTNFDVGLLRELYLEKKMSASETRRALGASHSTFYRLIRQSGISLRRRPKADPAEIRRLYAELGWTMEHIGRHLGLHGRTVKHCLLKNDVPLRGRHNYKYDPVRVRELIETQKMSITEVAAVLGACRTTVWRRLKRTGEISSTVSRNPVAIAPGSDRTYERQLADR
ncbi:MAG: hypothetical protein ACKVRN_15020 [Pyrinomonadaceae bacterium]